MQIEPSVTDGFSRASDAQRRKENRTLNWFGPHPAPLPGGEGKAVAGFPRILCLSDSEPIQSKCRVWNLKPEAVMQHASGRLLSPLPGGEGQGEGQTDIAYEFRASWVWV
jgi:hypothetical protein